MHSEFNTTKIHAGNSWLRFLSTSTIRTAGLCDLHFREEDFCDGTKKRLLRNRDPIHWKEISTPHGQTQAIVEPQESGNSTQVAVEVQELQEQVPSPREICDKNLQGNVNCDKNLQESVNCDKNLQEDVYCSNLDDFNIRKQSNPNLYPSGKELFLKTASDDTDLSFLNYELDVQAPIPCENVTVVSLVSEKDFRCSKECKILVDSLTKRINLLQIKVKRLEKRAKCVQSKYSYVRKQLEKQLSQKIRNIDDFLVTNKLAKDVGLTAKTIIKLQLRTKKTQYTDDEKELAKQIYFQSPTNYTKLRNVGLILPSESIVRTWFSRYDGSGNE
ncbi:uncharacterized protein LOC122577120 isoform X2 [Bombus pyrosoma]|uniref:uncharacterized protein LOC122577120 isoform X2 n=1 Tax=Bombus pyrosoma TaxID=396416 RepID=UPI001CB99805|nr:uncharacterized protein LOC122577120 isoform X2 [Bombus pyrosoma]